MNNIVTIETRPKTRANDVIKGSTSSSTNRLRMSKDQLNGNIWSVIFKLGYDDQGPPIFVTHYATYQDSHEKSKLLITFPFPKPNFM